MEETSPDRLESARKRHASRRLWVAGGFLPAGLLACAMAYAFFSLAWSQRSLRLHGVTADATVVELRMFSGDDRPSHGVRYRFRLDGVDYTAGDPLLRRGNVWATLTDEGWQQAQCSGMVPIVYDARDPRNNHPIPQPGRPGLTNSPWFWVAAGLPLLGIGFFCLLLGTAVL